MSIRIAALVLLTSAVSTAMASMPSRFVSDKSRGYFGYFLPTAPLAIGKLQLKDVSEWAR